MEEKIIEAKAKIKLGTKVLLILAGIIIIIVNDSIPWNAGPSGLYIGHYLLLLLGFLFIISPLILKFTLGKCRIFVTDKRVYGVAGFGKRVDLPLDTISAIGMGAMGSISVSTASGVISFYAIIDRDQVHKEINKLLINRQNKTSENTSTSAKFDAADELLKFKNLLDNGTITQEEFDAKKKQILDL